MRPIVHRMVFAALLLVFGIAGESKAAGFDGNWSVLIVTEKGDCDAAYRYAIGIANGQVRYAGDNAVNMSGTVTPTGGVKVSIKLGDKGANGTGQLSANAGAGTWHGQGSGASCAGRWEAEKR
jgi:hypothetical protein